MDDAIKRIVETMYELQVELFKRQGEQIEHTREVAEAALKGVDSLRRSHEILGRLMQATGELMGKPH